MSKLTAADLIEALGLEPHPEGGHYTETWRGMPGADRRAVATAIYFLLAEGERSQWHRIDAAELWLYHAGAPLELAVGDTVVRLGPDVLAGDQPQAVVPPRTWQAAVSTGDWTLVSCVVAPGFQFDGFELAPPDWPPADPAPSG